MLWVARVLACLEGFNSFVPPDLRRNLTYTKPDGSHYNGPVLGFRSPYSQGSITAQMSKLLTEEIFGIHYTHAQTAPLSL